MTLLLKALSIIAPETCLVCGREGRDLCPVCLRDLPAPLPERCFRCQKLNSGSKTCSTCRRHTPLKSVWVVGEYDAGLKPAIKAMKYERRRGLAQPLAQLLQARLPVFEKAPIITHVPTSTMRRRVRGYDQAQLLAKELAKLTGWKYIDLLRRQGQLRQVGARRLTRLAQLEDAFRAVRAEYIRGQDILLVDDVSTTGATLTVCGRTLKTAGARSVSAAVVAQKS